MKKVIIGFFLLAFIATGNSQILLEEAKVDYKPVSMRVDSDTQTLVIKIPEKTVGDFEKDPLAFMKKEFDVSRFIEENSDLHFTEFQVNFVSKKGYLVARFDKNGDLISSKQRFKNIRLPLDVQEEVTRQSNGAVVSGTKSFANSKGWDINKEFYKIKLEDGNKIKRLRIDRKNNQLSLAGI